ncbi:hypothetical protein Patl1_04309 [Pistacia atlantica]|uniref:Uncharacterized protein n=1 Tax=Pistacia atlantica TaxID=434234 RepID=A0ACC1BR50_9ROSI|nr:hypothetical protein Patl1_04309 [Pistacia atlantica]
MAKLVLLLSAFAVLLLVANASIYRTTVEELQEVDRRCRCQGLEQMVKHQQQQGQFRGEKIQELYETACELPRMCNIQPMQGCQFSSPYGSF